MAGKFGGPGSSYLSTWKIRRHTYDIIPASNFIRYAYSSIHIVFTYKYIILLSIYDLYASRMLAIEENNNEKLFLLVDKNALPDAEMPTLHQERKFTRATRMRDFSQPLFILGGRVRARAAASQPRVRPQAV